MIMKKFASRVKDIQLSEIRKIFDVAGEDTINLGIGEPDFSVPDHVREAVKDAVDEGLTHYTSNMGMEELREAIADKLKRENRVHAEPESIIVTVGASEAIFMCTQALLEEGDHALIPDPGFLSYDACVRLSGAVSIPVPLSMDEGFSMSPERVESLITEDTRVIIMNSPSNPTGSVMGKDDVRGIAEIAEDNDLIIISDEIYEKILYDGEHYSPARFTDNALIINGFSKTYAMTGLRIGYVAGCEDIIEELLKVHQYNTACAPSISQCAALAALRGPQDCVKDMVDEFRRRRDLMFSSLTDMGLECVLPGGAFYMFPHVGDSEEFSRLSLEAGVAVVPGSAFGDEGKGYVRMSYATSYELIEEAMERLRTVCGV
ncbi:MAG: pyridoxal phosphate-dependent aminotransferase [Methanothermobacter sp.]|nr:pyridoxal phosphate-dependent aminotransferase [Methanothermobacter sp.]